MIDKFINRKTRKTQNPFKKEGGVEKMTKKVEFNGNGKYKITETQAKIYDLYVNQNLTVKQIAKRRQISDKAVYKTLSKLKKKGIISKYQNRGLNQGGRGLTFQPLFSTKKLINSKSPKNNIRLHGQQFKIKVLYASSKYPKIIKEHNMFYLDGNTVIIYPKTILLTSNKSFEASTPHRAMSMSMQYFNPLFKRLEDRLGIIIIKGENTRIKMYNGHFAEMNNEIAKESNLNADRIKIYSKEDGKLWFLIDNSWNLNEAEVVHPKTNLDDAERIKQWFNEIRDTPNLASPIENQKLMQGLIQSNQYVVKNQVVFAENMRSHIKAVQDLSTGVNNFTNQVEVLNQKINLLTEIILNKGSKTP